MAPKRWKTNDNDQYYEEKTLEKPKFRTEATYTPENNDILFQNIPMECSGSLFVSQKGYSFKHFHLPEIF